jgi:hypothetical protein
LVRHDHPRLEQIITGFDDLVMDATAKPEWAEFGNRGISFGNPLWVESRMNWIKSSVFMPFEPKESNSSACVSNNLWS